MPNFPFPILFQDNHFVVINKPSGIACSKKDIDAFSIEKALPLLSRRKDGPWLVHRLDQETSGCLLAALRKRPLIEAQNCFFNGHAVKKYWAIVNGHPPEPSGTITAPLFKQNSSSGWKIVVDPQKGQTAKTQWQVLGYNTSYSWLELTLFSGRTHQIRVHCQYIGCPILGDSLYGKNEHSSNMQLHAVSLYLPLSPAIQAHAPAPEHMTQRLRSCGWLN